MKTASAGFMTRASCRKQPAALFDTDTLPGGRTPIRGMTARVDGIDIPREEAVEAARNICRACPVKSECLAYVRRHPEPQGIWAGLLPEER